MRRVHEAETNDQTRTRHKHESSWGRIIQHIEGNTTFAAISSYVGGFSEKENEKRHENLRRDIREMGYGYIEMDSGYTYQSTQVTAIEQAFFIPTISREEALQLGRKYDQESIIFKDPNQFAVLLSDSGAVDMEFQMQRGTDGQITFDPETLKIAFSRLRKGTHNQRGQSFAFRAESVLESFTVRAHAIPTRSEIYRAQKERVITRSTPISLEEYRKGRK